VRSSALGVGLRSEPSPAQEHSDKERPEKGVLAFLAVAEVIASRSIAAAVRGAEASGDRKVVEARAHRSRTPQTEFQAGRGNP
jgi:hypothetical protein